MTLYIAYRIGQFLALSLPRKVTYWLASVIADLYCLFSARDRKIVRDNLKIVLGGSPDERELKRMSREVFKNFAKYLADFLMFSRIDRDYIDKFVMVKGRDNIDNALVGGKGVIALSAHIGNWELGGAALGLIGYPLSAVVLTHQNKNINDFFTRQRTAVKFKPIEFGISLKACYQALKGNRLLALLGDRDFTGGGVLINFFGKQARIPKGPALFSYRIGSAIVPCFAIRHKDDTFTLFIEEPIYPDNDKNEEEAVMDLTKKHLAVIEAYVKRYPTQWYIFKNIWEN